MSSTPNTASTVRLYQVLAIDDNPSSTELTKITLENSGGYEVHEINDPHAALNAAQTLKPDLIIMDVDMPRMDGRTLALLIQSKEGLADTPILFLTSMIPESAGKNPFGWFGPLAKPVLPKTLANAVEKILRDRKAALGA